MVALVGPFIKAATSRARSSCVLPQQLRARSLVELDLACAAERRRRASKHSSILEARSPSEHASSAPCLRPQICRRGVQVLGLDTRKIHCVLAPGACFQENCVLAHLCRTRPYEQATGAGKRASTQTLRKHPSPANMVSASLEFTNLLLSASELEHGFDGFLLFTHTSLSSSFWGLPSRILNISHKKELLRGLWVCL